MDSEVDHDLLPAYAVDLIEQLDKQYPHRCYDPKQSYEKQLMYAGKREMIDSLLSRKEYSEREYGLTNL